MFNKDYADADAAANGVAHMTVGLYDRWNIKGILSSVSSFFRDISTTVYISTYIYIYMVAPYLIEEYSYTAYHFYAVPRHVYPDIYRSFSAIVPQNSYSAQSVFRMCNSYYS